MGQGRRQFTDEFKREAVALVASSGRPLTQIASELGIAPSMLRNWRNRGGGRNAGPALHPIPASALHSAPDPAAEISRLRRQHAPLCRNTGDCPFWSRASRDRAPRCDFWSRTVH